MKIVGWCERCRRIRPVQVTNAGLSRMAGGRHVAVGTCDRCRDAEDEERRTRDRERRDSRKHRRWGGNP